MKNDQKKATADPRLEEIRRLIREVIADGVDLDIPDDEIARVVKAETSDLERRVAALESAAKPAARPVRVDIVAETKARAEDEEAKAERRAGRKAA